MNTGESNNSKYKLINYCNENYDIRELYEAVTGRKPPLGKCYCIFHSNHNTPAAKIYQNKLKCFGECNRLFGCYDIIKEFFPQELERIKQNIILPEVKSNRSEKMRVLGRGKLDLTKSIGSIITQILEY